MRDPSSLNSKELVRQAQQYVESLRSAGVEWLPNAPAPVRQPVAGPALTETAQSALLFDDVPAGHTDTAPPSGTPEAVPLEQRRVELQVLSRQVAACTRCPELVATRSQTVFGVGQAGAELCFIGEAPGVDEDAQGEPFVGAAGQLLNRILAACQLKREEVYICNVIKCRPPGNRTPLASEAANCRGYLERQIELVRPKFICALGGSAAQSLLGTTTSLGKLRGRFHDYRGIPVLCTYHPAYLLPHRSPDKKKDVWQDMKLLMARMGRPVA
jgi:uracil-DNA glycosylase